MKITIGVLGLSVLVICLGACSARSPEKEADLVLRGGKVATVNPDFSIQGAVAVIGDRIVFVGKEDDLAPWIGPDTTIIDCQNGLVLPGLIDAHAHLHSLGDELTNLNVTGTESYDEIIERVAGQVKTRAPGEWIIGGRWDQNDWRERIFPVHDKLSAVSPDNPVYLTRIDGNAAFANARALAIAGITRDTPDPSGGVIVRKPDGEPSGVLVNRAMNLVVSKIPRDSDELYRKKFLRAVESSLEAGLTSIHEAGVGERALSLYKDLIDQGRLDIRLYAMLGDENEPEVQENITAYLRARKVLNYGGAGFLEVRSVKLYFDGALGSRGAAFYAPYADDPDNRGLLRISPEYIYEMTKAALEVGMQVNTHCIGIRGNRLCLEAYSRALAEVPVEDPRLRIEHAQIVRPEDVKMFSDLKIVPAMQPTHCTSDMPFVETRVGQERARGAYAWRWFRDAGLVIPFGSDFPVESNDPMKGIYAAVTRQDPEGHPEGGWFPEQRLTLEEAIRGFTIWAAYGAFQEDILGSIEVGKFADFTVLDRDILSAEPGEILNAQVVRTIVGGKVRFAR